MENRKKKAWIYTHIDAPEDCHGALKKQYEQLNTYGEQLQTEIAGSSSDTGGRPGLGRPGLNLFLEAKDSRGIEVLLVLDSTRIFREGIRIKKGKSERNKKRFPIPYTLRKHFFCNLIALFSAELLKIIQ